MEKENILILGFGEIGTAIYEILKNKYKIYVYDIDKQKIPKGIKKFKIEDNINISCIHVCIPYSEKFHAIVMNVHLDLNPKITIIHSSVRLKTTEKLKSDISSVVHSPVRGRHTTLVRDLKHFVKYVGADTEDLFNLALKYLSPFNCKRMNSSKESELAKLLSLSRYGLNLSFAREQNDICQKENLKYEDVVLDWESTYNSNVDPKFIRPMLTPPGDSIGGHCVIPIKTILEEDHPSYFLELIK